MKRGVGIFILLVLYVSLVFAATPKLSADAIQYSTQLAAANESMYKLQSLNFTIVRYNDTLTLAHQFFDAQVERERNNETGDYAPVAQKIKELRELEQNAYLISDELAVLRVNMGQTADVNISKAEKTYAAAYVSFKAERYEESKTLIDQTYQEISEAEATQTRVKALYEATSRTIASYIKDHWLTIMITIIVIAVLSVALYIPINLYLIKRKLQKLHIRAQSIHQLVAQSQKDYFEKGQLSESTFQIRTKKYAELLRDINRQIPLLKDEYVMKQKALFTLMKKKGERYDEIQ